MLSLHLDKGGLTVHYHSVRLPVSILSYPRILSLRLPSFEETYGPDHPSFRELWDLISDDRAPSENRRGRPGRRPGAGRGRGRDQGAAPAPVHGAARDPGAHRRNAADRERPEGRPGQLRPPRPDPLRAALLALLLAAGQRGDQLPAVLRRQRPGVACGSRTRGSSTPPTTWCSAWWRKGRSPGLRIDHVDGLHDPHGYLVRLMQRLTGSEDEDPAPGFYVLVEKILGEEEELPAEWPIHGTTGYDFLNALNGVFVSAKGVKLLDDVYARFIGSAPDFARDRVPEQEADHGNAPRGGDAFPRPAPRPAGRAGPVRPGPPPEGAARGDRRGDRLLPRLPDVRQERRAVRPRRPEHHEGPADGAAAEHGSERPRLRLPAAGAPARDLAVAAPRRTGRSGCGS